MAKTALGAEKVISWTHYNNGLAAAVKLRCSGSRLWALEGGPRSESLFDGVPELIGPSLVFVVGSEISGVDPGILELCDRVVCLPMRGIKTSLNASVAFGIVVYLLKFGSLLFNSEAQDRVAQHIPR
jgi:tRNA G18 (ribose-2'-O)-methylase SpoU